MRRLLGVIVGRHSHEGPRSLTSHWAADDVPVGIEEVHGSMTIEPDPSTTGRDDLYGDVYPESWYAVAPSSSLAPGTVTPIEAFSRKWVMFRTRRGTVHFTQRFCPHMGASLHTGFVDGEHIVCPFHHWQYDGEGICRAIPYVSSDKIPPRARLATLPCIEHLGWLWVYHGAPRPAYDLPDLPEARDPRFSRRHKSQSFNVHPLLILENGCDPQHLKFVHKIDFLRYDVEMQREETHAFAFRVNQAIAGPFGKALVSRLSIRYVGASTIFGTLETGDRVTAKFIAAPLPISHRRTQFHLIVFPRRLPRPLFALDSLYATWFAERLFRGSTDDYLPIWQHMDSSYRGALVADDALQQRFRHYYRAHLPRPSAPMRPGASSSTTC